MNRAIGAKVFAEYRSRWVPLVMMLLGSSALVACHKDKPQPAKPAASAQAAVKKSPEEVKRLIDAAQKSLAELRPQIDALTAKFAELHKEYDPLPPGLPDFGETRGRFYAAAEGLGMMSAKLSYISGRLDAASKSGDGSELDDLTKDLASTYKEIIDVNHLTVQLARDVKPFQKAREARIEDFVSKGKKVCE